MSVNSDFSLVFYALKFKKTCSYNKGPSEISSFKILAVQQIHLFFGQHEPSPIQVNRNRNTSLTHIKREKNVNKTVTTSMSI